MEMNVFQSRLVVSSSTLKISFAKISFIVNCSSPNEGLELNRYASASTLVLWTTYVSGWWLTNSPHVVELPLHWWCVLRLVGTRSEKTTLRGFWMTCTSCHTTAFFWISWLFITALKLFRNSTRRPESKIFLASNLFKPLYDMSI